MKRITKQTKAIADAHIAARLSGKFDNPRCKTQEEVISSLRDGKTFEAVLNKIEFKHTHMTPIVLSRIFQNESKAYVSGVYKGFRILLD
jgi:hypothetical protein